MLDINPQPNQVSSFKLKASYWYISHKLQLRQGLIIFLIILSLVLYSYSVYKALRILLVDDSNFQQNLNYLPADLIDYSYFHQANKPQDLQILSFEAVDGREGRYDFVAKVKNPNLDFATNEVLLQLISAGEVIAEKTSFIFPNEEKYMVIFGQEVSAINPIIKIARVDWQRFRQFEEFFQSRLKFEVSDVEFKSSRDSGIEGQLPVSTLNFKIANNSAYSYWQVGIYMILLNGQRVVGANYLSLDQFFSGQGREVEMRWYESLPPVSQIMIMPEVNILRDDYYMPVE